MYIFKGFNPITQEEARKKFDNESEAIAYGSDNASDFPNYKITDLDTDDVIYSSQEDEDAKATAMDNLFPDEESMEGFDWTLGS